MITALGRTAIGFAEEVGGLALFSGRTLRELLRGWPTRRVILICMHKIGVQSLPVVLATGAFLGMVLAIQGYDQLRWYHLETQLGAAVGLSIVKELGPVLAATMLAGRVGSSIAAELGTMRVTEQIDALRALGANPITYLVVPRFLACFLLIPMLTAIGDGIGILGGWLISTQFLGLDSFHFWHRADLAIRAYDIFAGLVKSIFFGGAIALISCHRGFHCGAGAEGVGRAATESFVYSFVAILGLDLILGIVQNSLSDLIRSL